jgi:putative nucleotidyltransferase with HDIG domain
VPAPLKARALLWATIGAGAAIVAAAAIDALSAPATTLAFFVAAVIVTELLQVPRDEQSVDPTDAHTVGFSSGVHLAAVMLLGPWTAALVAASGVLTVDRMRGSQWRRILFNASAFAVSAVAGGMVYGIAGGQTGTIDLPSAFPAIGALVLTYFFVNTLLICCVVAFHAGTHVWPYFLESCRKEFQPKAAEAGIAVSIAALAVTKPWALVALGPLAVAVYQSHMRLALQRRETGRALETFANVVDERDSHTYRHSSRVADYVAGLAEALRLPGSDVARLRWAGRLHDLGKIAVDSAVINKPGTLSDDEWTVMRRHPRLSARLLRRFRLAAEEARAVEYHHERFDGRGYYSIETEGVPLAAHFLIVADSFDAMTSSRPYREGMPMEHALDQIEENAGKQFHPLVARAFVAHMRGEDPTQVLSTEERYHLRDVFGRGQRRRIRGVWSGTAERALLGGLLVSLLAVGFGSVWVASAGAGLVMAAIAARQRRFYRARRLTAFLRAIAQPRSRPDLVLQGLGATLAADGNAQWAGIVRWNQQELAGRVELSWGDEGAAPGESPLMSWLLREAESEDALLRTPGAELGTSGDAVAVTLRHDRVHTTFLLLVFASRLPRHAELALRGLVAELELALKPGPELASVQGLAVAS